MKVYCLIAFLTLGIASLALAQDDNKLVGTWKPVSVTLDQDGKKTDEFGANPPGQAIFEANGRFDLMFIRADIPKFASTNRKGGTAEENQAATQGSLAYYGTYTINESEKSIMYHLEGSSFPNWRGADQKRFYRSDPAPSQLSSCLRPSWKRLC